MSNDQENDKGISVARARVTLEVGEFVRKNNTVYRLTQILDFSSVLGVDVETGRSTPLKVGELLPLEQSQDVRPFSDIAEIADEDWRIASERYAVILPLVKKGMIGRAEVVARAKEIGKDPATLYRWISSYNGTGVVSSLIPQRRGWKEGKLRIPLHADQVIEEVIRSFYLTPQRPTVQKTVIEVRRVCMERGIAPPSQDTIRARILKISEKDSMRERGFKEQARKRFLPTPGKFPNADYPLAVVQIDHTPVDVILVDDVYRRPIGRPWLTLAIDVYSRMVVGYYLSFDAPSATSVGLCIAHAMLPKESWLQLHNVDADWPVWGKPNTIHVDNGSDFRSDTFRQSCLQYGIHLEFRPVKRPNYGGHIERLIGSFMKEVHAEVPGTTFSNIKARDGYDSEKNAVMTKAELERWLIGSICNKYHKDMHSGIGMSPYKKWEIGIFGNKETQGVGMAPRPTDLHAIQLDFLPAFERTVQTTGVTIDGMKYYAEALRPWINSIDSKSSKKKGLIFRRDPRDISTIWFFDPFLKEYYKIPCADQNMPATSYWEYRQAREKLKRDGHASVNEHQVLQAITELRAQVEASKEKTKRARRQSQRRIEHEKKVTPAAPLIDKVTSATEVKKSLQQGNALSNLFNGDLGNLGDLGEIA